MFEHRYDLVSHGNMFLILIKHRAQFYLFTLHFIGVRKCIKYFVATYWGRLVTTRVLIFRLKINTVTSVVTHEKLKRINEEKAVSKSKIGRYFQYNNTSVMMNNKFFKHELHHTTIAPTDKVMNIDPEYHNLELGKFGIFHRH